MELWSFGGITLLFFLILVSVLGFVHLSPSHWKNIQCSGRRYNGKVKMLFLSIGLGYGSEAKTFPHAQGTGANP
jgi:hypothetical protein